MSNQEEIRNILREAARIIERDGWHQGDFFRDDPKTGPVCALGALRRAIASSASGEAVSGKLYCEAAGLVEKAASEVIPRVVLPAWNDAPERTAEDVILALKRAADG
ncbi:hypothetical protein BJP40_06485 [Streptomyces sp. CC53]|uniref:DUF6197 family protein n=1 Tax=Streptomyces sp. CC53 TaxID=1906740 RepID=UPI0008DE393E|nr:hypothetical protein [Streptomyces sp. CC53]OII61170.1 hypothetical protein BJP40_06485 [Streptomyces sp. CC53]